ncbi:hypothetical protein ABKN59_010901 [Abortiporus biennis]
MPGAFEPIEPPLVLGRGDRRNRKLPAHFNDFLPHSLAGLPAYVEVPQIRKSPLSLPPCEASAEPMCNNSSGSHTQPRHAVPMQNEFGLIHTYVGYKPQLDLEDIITINDLCDSAHFATIRTPISRSQLGLA